VDKWPFASVLESTNNFLLEIFSARLAQAVQGFPILKLILKLGFLRYPSVSDFYISFLSLKCKICAGISNVRLRITFMFLYSLGIE